MSNGNEGFTQRIAAFVAHDARSELNDELLTLAKLALLDWTAVTIAARDEPLVKILAAQAEGFGGAPQASLVGRGGKVSAIQAALVNGAMSHALDFDDNLSQFMGHPTVTLMPALLAIAEWRGLSGKEVLGAYLCGLRTGSILATSVGFEHYNKGFHGTSTIGRQASTAACSYLLGLDEARVVNALGVAGTLANGVKQSFGSMCKPLHAGAAAEGGVQAATLAEEGFRAADDIYEGRLGFILTHHGLNESVDIAALGARHPVLDLELKFHAACFFLHGGINGMLHFKKEHGFIGEDVERIDVDIAQISCDTAGKEDPQTGLDGKFSMRYSLANALVTGDTGMSGYTDERVHNPATRAVMAKINRKIVNDFDDMPLKARLGVTLKDGRCFEGVFNPLEVTYTPEEKDEMLSAKFFDLVTPALGEAQARELRAAILEFDNAATIDDVMALMSV